MPSTASPYGYAELPDGPDELTAYDGDHRIGPVKAVEWNKHPSTPSEPGRRPVGHPTRSRYLDALTRKGEEAAQSAGRHSLPSVGGSAADV